VPALHQFTPTLDAGAVGAHTLEIQRTLRAAGWDSEVFSEHTRAPYEGRAHGYTEYGRSVPAHETDVVVYHTAIGSSVADWLMTERPARLVLDYHNITPPTWFEGWEPDLAYGLAWGRGQLRRLARRVQFALADSAFNARELGTFGFRRTGVLPILVPQAALGGPPDSERLASLRAVPGGHWLFVGRLAPNKRQHVLIAALAAHRRVYDDRAHLSLVGAASSPRYEAALRRYATELGIGDAVDFTGAISDAARNAYYASADVFMCASAHEGFLVPLLEAWANDVPVIAHAATAVPETLGDAGLLLRVASPVTLAAAAARVCSDALVADGLRAAGRVRLEHFSLARAEARLLDVAGQLAGGMADRPGIAALRGAR
jgi:glycosyltransferase involved in cell wall biosynthesis